MANDSYSVLSGEAIYGGRFTPLPLWRQGAPLNEVIQIAGTTGAGGAPADGYSGWAKIPDGRLVIAAAGGHGTSQDNRVVSINPRDDAPAWSNPPLLDQSPSHTSSSSYDPNGQPASSHTYAMHAWIAALERVMTFGRRFVHGSAGTYLVNDAFSLETNTWDAPGTWPDVPTMDGGGCVDLDGNYWFFSNQRKATASGGVLSYSQPLTSTAANRVRYPWSLNTNTGEMFGLCWGNGEGGESGVRAIKQNGNVQAQVTFNASAALTQFTADASVDAGMTYDPINDWHVWYSGEGATVGRFYKVIPNAGTVWDMEILAFTGTISTTAGGGLQSKFTYDAVLGGIVFLPAQAANVHFIRTAP